LEEVEQTGRGVVPLAEAGEDGDPRVVAGQVGNEAPQRAGLAGAGAAEQDDPPVERLEVAEVVDGLTRVGRRGLVGRGEREAGAQDGEHLVLLTAERGRDGDRRPAAPFEPERDMWLRAVELGESSGERSQVARHQFRVGGLVAGRHPDGVEAEPGQRVGDRNGVQDVRRLTLHGGRPGTGALKQLFDENAEHGPGVRRGQHDWAARISLVTAQLLVDEQLEDGELGPAVLAERAPGVSDEAGQTRVVGAWPRVHQPVEPITRPGHHEPVDALGQVQHRDVELAVGLDPLDADGPAGVGDELERRHLAAADHVLGGQRDTARPAQSRGDHETAALEITPREDPSYRHRGGRGSSTSTACASPRARAVRYRTQRGYQLNRSDRFRWRRESLRPI
jgi:hypothetical protein